VKKCHFTFKRKRGRKRGGGQPPSLVVVPGKGPSHNHQLQFKSVQCAHYQIYITLEAPAKEKYLGMVGGCSQTGPSALMYASLSFTRCAGFPSESERRAGSQPNEALPDALDNPKNSRPPDPRVVFPFWTV